MDSTTRTPDRTVIGHSTTDKVVLFGGLPLIGLALGFFLPRIADWAAGQRWVPFQGPLKLIAGWDGWWVVVICVVVGLVAGVLLAGAALDDTLKVTVTNRSVEFLKNQRTVVVPREKVAVAFLDGKELVLQDAASRELAREKHDQLTSDASRSRPRSGRTVIRGRTMEIRTSPTSGGGSRTSPSSHRRSTRCSRRGRVRSTTATRARQTSATRSPSSATR